MLPSSFQVKKISSSKSDLSNLKCQQKHEDVTTITEPVILTWHKACVASPHKKDAAHSTVFQNSFMVPDGFV